MLLLQKNPTMKQRELSYIKLLDRYQKNRGERIQGNIFKKYNYALTTTRTWIWGSFSEWWINTLDKKKISPVGKEKVKPDLLQSRNHDYSFTDGVIVHQKRCLSQPCMAIFNILERFISPKCQQVDCPVLKLQLLQGMLRTIRCSSWMHHIFRNNYHFVVTLYIFYSLLKIDSVLISAKK